MRFRTAFVLGILGMGLNGLGCDAESLLDSGDATEGTAGESGEVECVDDSDCELRMNIAVWDATCSEEGILLVPTGDGLDYCVEGVCTKDFTLIEEDCAAKGQVCSANPDGPGDQCLDP